MASVTEDIEAFLTLHNRFKAGTLPAEQVPAYHELRKKVQSALLEPTSSEAQPSNVIPLKRPALA